MNDLNMCTEKGPEEFKSWLLSVEKISKLTGNDPKNICFTKAKRNLNLLYFI